MPVLFAEDEVTRDFWWGWLLLLLLVATPAAGVSDEDTGSLLSDPVCRSARSRFSSWPNCDLFVETAVAAGAVGAFA